MPIDPDALPDDAAVLREALRTVLLQHGELHAKNDELRLLIQRLTRQQFGRRSEQLSPDQLQLGLEDLEQTIAPNQAAQDAIGAGVTAGPVPTRLHARAIVILDVDHHLVARQVCRQAAVVSDFQWND